MVASHNINVQVKNACADSLADAIEWQTSDLPYARSAGAVMMALWDINSKTTTKLDFWDKTMTPLDVKRFVIDIIDGLAETVEVSTGDKAISAALHEVFKELSAIVEEESAQTS